MQNKGLVRVFLFLIAAVSIYQLFFTWKAKNIEKQAIEYAVGKADMESGLDGGAREAAIKKHERYYLDSLNNVNVIDIKIGSWSLLNFTYQDIKNRELSLGLDLKGGVSVILEVSVSDILKGLSDNSKDPVFNQAILKANEIHAKNPSQDYIATFQTQFEELAKADGRGLLLSSPEIFGTPSLRSRITPEMANEAAVAVVRQESAGAVDRAFEILRSRIDKFGVTSPTIQRLPGKDQIMIELAGVSDVERVRKLLQSTAALEFWRVYTTQEAYAFLAEAESVISEIENAKRPADPNKATETQTESETDSLENLAKSLVSQLDEQQKQSAESFSFLNILVPEPNISYIASAAVKDTALVNYYLNLPEVQSLLPQTGMAYARFYWESKPREEDKSRINLYAIKGNINDEAPLGGDVIDDAVQTFDQKSQPAVSMRMNAAGARTWAKMTEEAKGNCIAIVLDRNVYSAPQVNDMITGGQSEISGNFEIKEAQDLANILKAGKLPAPAHIIQSEIVGPSLGQESIDAGMMSFFIALAIVFLWMIFYYSKTGIFANVALLVNILFIFGILASLGATLTLPGIAGIVLTLGMAVDANVIIDERIKEELKAGKSARQAIDDGYGNAYSSILDSNITTFLTSLILFVFGKGPIQGFATTMMIGLVTSLITSIFVTRLFLEADLRKGRKLSIETVFVRNWYKNVKLTVIENRKKFYIFSAMLILICIAGLAMRGLDQGVDFVGGRTYTIRFDKPVVTEEVAASLAGYLVENGREVAPEVKTFGSANQVKIVTRYRAQETGANVDGAVDSLIYQGVRQYLPEQFSMAEFTSGEGYGIMDNNVVGPTMAKDIKISTVWAIALSLVTIFLYILIRFKKWQFSAGAILALCHDVMVVFGVFALFHGILPFSLQMDQSFVAAILTVIGYSLNNTVVIFDRIREELKLHPKHLLDDNFNGAINKTISRTVNTSLTTFLTLFAIFVFGGETIRGFMFAMMTGVFVGTFTSVFIATPVTWDLITMQEKRKMQKAVEGRK